MSHLHSTGTGTGKVTKRWQMKQMKQMRQLGQMSKMRKVKQMGQIRQMKPRLVFDTPDLSKCSPSVKCTTLVSRSGSTGERFLLYIFSIFILLDVSRAAQIAYWSIGL